LNPLVNAFDIANPNCPTVLATANLDEASQTMEHEGLDEIPVVDCGPYEYSGEEFVEHGQ